MSHNLRGKLLVLSAAVLLSVPFISSRTALASPVNYPMQITPICADAATNLAYWKVVNDNPSSVSVNWMNFDFNQWGTNIVPTASSTMTTYYKAGANNTTRFDWTYGNGTTNSSNTPCSPGTTGGSVAPAECLPTHISDGYLQQHIRVVYTGKNTVQLTYDALNCNVAVNFSAYVMPANYNGNGFFGNLTAYPQPLFDTTTVNLAAGKAGTTDLTVNLPNSCNNTQVDVYFGNVISTVGPQGHGTYNLGSQVYKSTGTCPVVGGRGGGNGPTAPTATAPMSPAPAPVSQAAPGPQPAMLANTGTSPVPAYTAALGLALLTALGTWYVRKATV